MSIDMYLPALPSLAVEFGADPGYVQLSLASFFLGLAIGQAFYGPLTDRFGRKKPLIVGLILFVVTSAGCAITTSINALIALRFFQALGACSGQVIARAVVRDLFDAREAVRVFSLLILVMGVSPVLAPLIGGQIQAWFNWRVIFWTIAATAMVGLVASILRLPETHRQESIRPLQLGEALGVYVQLLKDRSFMAYALTGGLALGGMFAYIAGSPFVFIELFKVPETRFGFFFGANAFGFIMSAQLNRKLGRRFTSNEIIAGILVIEAITGILLLAGTLAGFLGLWSLAVLLFIYVSSVGCMIPNTTALALAAHGDKAGSASALIGTIQFSLAAVSALIVGAANNGTALPMTTVIALCGTSALILYRVLTHGTVESSKRSTDEWIHQYELSHQHPMNRFCHTVGIPIIAASLPLFVLSAFVPGLWVLPSAMFAAGWIFQFAGHVIERKPPEFFSDWRFLFVGLRWWFAKIRRTRA